ncbi:MAG: ligase-associated DNA damage response DEXH box helicase, partial [Phycisphaerales bacterium]|nr:ligase-associated DNA damage response DEXH box helicase [Phycisphaerales bacterium]
LTPLRALAQDTLEALTTPVETLGLPWSIEVRTGDTTASVRRRQQQRPPTALITTPESVSVLLSYKGARVRFGSLRVIVVDEWHELLGSKRGVQAELALARLRVIAPNVITWGLSATMGNLEEAMATLLAPAAADAGRLIRGRQSKDILIETARPVDVVRFPWAGHLGLTMLEDVVAAIESARSTLVFTNTRSQAERWFRALLETRPDWLGAIAIHHGSLARPLRAEVERRLRAGDLRAVVCTSSLDLGVDFTPVERVVQIGSPKGVARTLQRAGRSGHQPGATSRLLGVPTHALELVEFAAARDAITAADMETRPPLDRPLDVLVQHLVTIAAGEPFDPDAMRDEVRATHAYHRLTDEEWSWALDFLTRGGAALTAYPEYARLTLDDGRMAVSSERLTRRHRMTIGTITGASAMNVRFVRGKRLGSIEEAFINRLRPGDTFVMAGRVLRLERVRDMTAYVTRARGRAAVVPRWMGGRSPLSSRLAAAIRTRLEEARRGVYRDELETVRPLLELQAAWSRIPAPDELLIERTRSRHGHHTFVFSFAGRLANEGLATLVAYRLGQRSPRSLSVTANDYGFELLGREPLEVSEEEWRALFTPDTLVDDLLACLNATELARRRFRDIARVAGLVFPGFPGQGKTTRQLQASSDLFYDVFREYDPGNQLLSQARREVLERELEVSRLRETLELLTEQRIVPIETPRLTPLAFPLWADRMRAQMISSERWRDRVERMAAQLERAAATTTGAKR